MKLTVIIPVYCVEATLDRCVESVLRQDVPDMEVILVDDGSPDRCPQMCDDWKARDARICVIHKENGFTTPPTTMPATTGCRAEPTPTPMPGTSYTEGASSAISAFPRVVSLRMSTHCRSCCSRLVRSPPPAWATTTIGSTRTASQQPLMAQSWHSSLMLM